MALPDIFSQAGAATFIERIESLKPDTQPVWGKMSVDQMFAHCCVSYEMAFENKHKKPGSFARFLLKRFIKPVVVSDKPYSKNSRTAPAFLIADQRNFEAEKARLIAYLHKTVELGPGYFDGKESLSFGPLNVKEWNTMFAKHLDHHLQQFGA